jgi:hypothetical protein
MTPERIEEIRQIGNGWALNGLLVECLAEIQRLQAALPTPAKEPSSEYVNVIKDALHDLNKLNNAGWTPNLTTAMERARKIHADLTEALAARKSHPTPAKEPSGELGKAIKALEWAKEYIDDGTVDSPTETPQHHCDYIHNPESGHCEFHQKYSEMCEALAILKSHPMPAKEKP